MLSWTSFLERHDRRRAIALNAARQGPSAVATTIVEAFDLHPSAQSAIADLIQKRPPSPPTPVLFALLQPADTLEQPPMDRSSDLQFREYICRRGAAGAPDDETLRLATLCAALLGHAQDHQDYNRDAWAAVTYPPHARDEATLSILRREAAGARWEIMSPLQRLTWPTCRGVFQVGMRGLHLPVEVQLQALDRLEENWSYLLIAGSKERGPALPELLLRAVETLGKSSGPVRPVAGLLSPNAWDRLATELASGRWKSPLSHLYRRPRGRLARLAAIASQWRTAPDRFEQDMFAVVVLRLITIWSQRPEPWFPVAGWRRCEASYNRGRARLRAAASSCTNGACAALASSPGPYARLIAGVKRYAYALFWVEAQAEFPAERSAAPKAPEDAADGLAELMPTPEAMGALRGWVLLAVLRGDGALVAAWRDRRVRKIAGTWDRRQKERQVPLYNPKDVEGAHRLARLSLALDACPELLAADGTPGEELMPYLARVAALDGNNRRTLDMIRDILRDASAPGPPSEPKGGAPTMVREARRWLSDGKGAGGDK